VRTFDVCRSWEAKRSFIEVMRDVMSFEVKVRAAYRVRNDRLYHYHRSFATCGLSITPIGYSVQLSLPKMVFDRPSVTSATRVMKVTSGS
jgi:hypothetical protein